MQKVPVEIQNLVGEREKLRNEKKFHAADAVREQIAGMGYKVTDTGKGVQISQKDVYVAPKKSFLVLFGSGEVASSGVKVHARVLERIGKENPSIIILSTPAGFQPNVKIVAEEIKSFFEKHLQNYHPKITIVYANSLKDANNSKLIKPLETADYIFMGPGSPTYALHQLKNSLLYNKIAERLQKGASLGLASAATMAFSCFTLPVYEIFKAGFNPYWEDGLNLYATLFQELTVIPHFNNTEGGKKNDTSRAWMGKKRFGKLMELLPPNQCIWGIDEHTAVFVDLQTKNVNILGKGNVWEVKSGKTIPLEI